jgi:hypothetical protein
MNRKNILIIVLAALLIFAGVKFLKPKKSGSVNRSKATRDSLKLNRQKGKKGKTAGQIKPKTKAELAAEKKKIRAEEKLRRREEKRRKREEVQARRLSRQKGKNGKKTVQLYQLTAIVTIGLEKFALIDSRRITKNDDIMGRKVLDILNDRIIIDEFGRTREVKIGESVLPQTSIPKIKR